MARPLPEDVEQQIAGTARRAEIRSVAVFSFILGAIIGAGLVLGYSSEHMGGSLGFGVAASLVAGVWFFASRRK